MTQNKITGETSTSFSSDLPEQTKSKKAYNKSSFKNDFNKVKTWSLYASFVFVILLVLMIICVYYAGSTPEMRYSDLKAVINYLVNNGIPASIGFVVALFFARKK